MSSFLIILAVLAVAVFFIVGIYNGLIQKKVTTDNAWSQIDVQLKRRHDLIPNLVEVVKGYASHERETLQQVIQARNSAVTVSQSGDVKALSQAEGALSGALRQLFALSESYPDLKANQNFAQLQEELVSTENKISFSRQHYNDSVGVYNTAIQQVPANFVASFAGFKDREFFELEAGEAEAVKQVPQVSFS